QQTRVLALILLSWHGVGVERHDVSSAIVWPQIEMRNEAVLAAAVTDEVLAEVIFDKVAQPNRVFAIAAFGRDDGVSRNRNLWLPHFFEGGALEHLLVNFLLAWVAHQE